jgi:hypothetical protein
MKFRVYNHKAAADHRFQNVVIDAAASPDAFARMVVTACGNGLNAAFTSKAIETSARLLTLLPGQELRVATKWLDLALNHHDVDITLTRIED